MKNSYIGWIVAIFTILILTLPFHYVIEQHDNFTMFPKNQITFSNTFLTHDDIEGLIKRYNDASLYEKQAMNSEPLIRKLKEKGILIDKGLFDNDK